MGWIKRKVEFAISQKKQLSINEQSISQDLVDNYNFLTELFKDAPDIVFRSFTIGENDQFKGFLIAIDGLYDKTIVYDHVIKPLMEFKITETTNHKSILNQIEKGLLSISELKKETSMQKAIENLMKGDPLLFIDKADEVFIIGARSWEKRGIEAPTTETVIRGPQEAFGETLQTNISMLRRRIHHPNLKIKQMVIGRLSQTDISIAYIENIVSNDILNELMQRLQKINIDAVLDSGYIEELIADRPYSLFPTVGHTERPDTVAVRLLEGRVAIFVDGAPMVLVVPFLMMESMQSPEDYSSHFYYSSLMRILRLMAFFIATILPAAYVAAQSYHTEMFPTAFLIHVASAREGVPLPLFVEVFLMIIIFELLKETGIRMPNSIGPAVAIVGGLILGESAVDAGLIGTTTIIVIASTAITTYLIPALHDTMGILRLLYLISAGVFGMYGVTLMASALFLHVASLHSFGVNYMAPWFPITWSGWKDLFIRVPLWDFNQRPEFIPSDNQTRQGNDQKPEPTKKGDED